MLVFAGVAIFLGLLAFVAMPETRGNVIFEYPVLTVSLTVMI
jgi:hypothetical protein